MPASLGTQYATIADLAAVAAPTNALFGVTAAQQNTALETASRICDDSLSVVYTLPLLTFGTSLVQHVCNIAVYYLFSGKGAAIRKYADVPREIQRCHAVAQANRRGVAPSRHHRQLAQHDRPGRDFLHHVGETELVIS